MKPFPLLTLGLFFVASTFATTALGQSSQESLEDSLKREVADNELSRLKGWEKITFICAPLSKNSSAAAQKKRKEICALVEENVKTLAEVAGASVEIAKSWESVGISSAFSGSLKLSVDLTLNDCAPLFCALAGQVSAEFFYYDAIDSGKGRLFERDSNKRHPIRTPKSVNVELWSSGIGLVTGAGTDDFSIAAVSMIDNLLKDFFRLYAKANR